MSTNQLGSNISRFLQARDTQYSGVIFQKKRPPLDAELNLLQSAEAEARAEALRASVPSGWLMNELNPFDDFTTDQSYSNLFFFGRQSVNELRSMPTAIVNGWVIPVAGTRTGQPPLNPNNAVTWNQIELNPPSASTGGNKSEFVFLEVWLQRIDVDPASPGIAPGKPARGFIYRFGNVESGFSHIKDELIDPSLNKESTKRVQIQYRIRVVSGVNLSQYPEGFDPTLVYAIGAKNSTSLPFSNMRTELGDPGLWRAGDGNTDTTGTVDGYVYAIPICSVFRRNGAGFSDTGNIAGAFNRNSVAVDRNGACVFSNQVTLPVNIDSTTTQFTLSSIQGTILETISSFGEAYFKIDDEIIRITNITQNGPTSYVITVDRGQLQTIIRPHVIGVSLVPYTIRPDGLYADQVASTDILDLRHSVSEKFDYDSILKTAVHQLLKGNLRSTWKRYGSTNSSGNIILYGDRITDGTVSVGGLSRLDGPNGNRRTWSDAVVTERYNIQVQVPSNSTVVGSPIQINAAPYISLVTWEAAAPLHGQGQRLSGSDLRWWNGDIIRISKTPYIVGLPASDSDQVRFVTPSEDNDAVLVHFEGMTTDPSGGAESATTSNSATTVRTGIVGNRILKNGQGITVTTDPLNGDLLITLNSGIIDTVFQEFADVFNGIASPDTAFISKVSMHVSVGVVYGSGRGLSHKPDFVHTVHYRGNTSNTTGVIRRAGLSDKNRMVPTYLNSSPLVQTGRNRTYSETSEVMIDPGSKTVHVAPYKNLVLNNLLVRSGERLNWYGSGTYQYQGAMPTLSPDGSTTVHNIVDPLGLFTKHSTTLFVEVPIEYLPKPGLHRIPIVASSTTTQSSGINFFLLSKEGPITTTSDHNQYLVGYPTGPGYYVATPRVGESYGTGSGGTTMFGQKVTRTQLKSVDGGAFQGIQFPVFMGPARITGIYLRNGASLVPNPISPFNSDRVYTTSSGTSVNLLKDDFDGPTILIETDENGDSTFIINKDVIDFSKIQNPNVGYVNPSDTESTTKFNNVEFLVECTVFGFDRGWLETNGRIILRNISGANPDIFINSVGLVVPAPLNSGSTNNELTVYYSRQPYQGDVFGTQNAFSDDTQKTGPLSVSEATSIYENNLTPTNLLELPNKKGFEILAGMNFVSSLGTGRLSGSIPTPLLTKSQNPDGPIDYAGSLYDLHRRFSLNRVGYDDWSSQLFPVTSESVSTRPQIERDCIDEIFDNNISLELAGSIAHLPLGAYLRDKDFIGKTLYQVKASSGVGQVNIGAFSHVPYQASMDSSVSSGQSFQGIEFITGSSTTLTGVGGEKIVISDGTNSYTSQSIFKTTRGGAGWCASGSPISSKMPKAKPNTTAGSVLVATAYLVRSQPEYVNNVEVHNGNELQLVIVTEGIPSYFKKTDLLHSANGTNEGFTAVDRYRIWGKPLEKRRGFVDAANSIPGDKPLFNNDIYDDPIFFGSSDINTTTVEQETLSITVAGQTVFSLSKRPISAKAVMVYRNGNILDNGVDYTVTGPSLRDITFIQTEIYGNNPPLSVGETLVAFYVVL